MNIRHMPAGTEKRVGVLGSNDGCRVRGPTTSLLRAATLFRLSLVVARALPAEMASLWSATLRMLDSRRMADHENKDGLALAHHRRRSRPHTPPRLPARLRPGR